MCVFNVTPLFSSNLYKKNINTCELEKTVKDLIYYAQSLSNTTQSNIGGEQFIFNNEDQSQVIQNIKSIILKETREFPQFKIKSMWLNINHKNNFNITHTHPDCDYCGVLYIKTPKNSGSIRFQNPHGFARSNYFFKLSESERITTLQYPQYEIFPEKGDLLMFPADLPHYVMPSNSEEERVSLAFNIDFL